MGRRNIEMKMVKDSSSRQVTFSKRRTGLFKKANELATLCAAQIAIVVFSPGGKPFSFGHPTVQSVADRFLNQDKKTKVSTYGDGRRLEKLNNQFSELQRKLQFEKKEELLHKAMEANGIENFKSMDEMGIDELLKMKKDMEELRENMNGRVKEMEASSSLLLLSNKPIRQEK